MAGTHRDRDRDRVVFTANLVVCIVSRTNRYDLFYTYEHLADQWKHFLLDFAPALFHSVILIS